MVIRDRKTAFSLRTATRRLLLFVKRYILWLGVFSPVLTVVGSLKFTAFSLFEAITSWSWWNLKQWVVNTRRRFMLAISIVLPLQVWVMVVIVLFTWTWFLVGRIVWWTIPLHLTPL